MSKLKNPFDAKRIRKRRKKLPAGTIRRLKAWLHRYDQLFRYAAVAVVIAMGMWLVYAYQQTGGYLFKASVLEAPQSFSGTVYPIDRVPDWTNWNGDNRTTPYTSLSSNLLVSLPGYDLQEMQFPSENLEWGNPDHNEIRNTKITYPVVYMGNYQLDHQEYAGSHPAVDIKVPVGTPVKSIANGRVVKTSMQASGFGHHIVIQHRNVPDLNDPNRKVTLYSAYNHMDDIYVSEGESVTKGQVIGTSGDTGTATTPHLHFQIDRDSAPWHPYWPFSSADSRAAGLSFFEAVNAGLGSDNGRRYTINPMLYVSEYLDYNGSAVDSGPDNTTDDSNGDSHNNDQPDDPQDPPEDTQDPPQTVTEEAIPEDPAVETVPEDQPQSNVDTSLFAFRLTGESVSMVNNGVMVTATDQGDQVSRMSDADEVRVTLHGVGRVSKKSFRKVDFKSGSIQFIVNSSDAGTARVEVGKSVHEITFVDRVSPIASLRIDTDGAFQKGQVEIIRLIALDDSGNPTPVVNFAGSISVQAKQGDARFTPDRLAVNDFVNGIAEVRMMANSESPIVIRAQNGAIIGESNTLSAEARQQFTDVTKAHPNYEAIKYLHDQSIITGYSDGSFRPADTVNRVEALKMLMLAFGLEAGPVGQLPFTDTQDSAWYAPTLGTAIDKQIVKGYEDGTFRPDKTVNKAEYLKMLFLTGGITPENDLSANPYSDVPKDAWYAPFAYLTNKMNLLDVPTGRLSAGSGMTRGDVAETIYRLKYVQDHDLLTYSK